MTPYEQQAWRELEAWKVRMRRRPSVGAYLSRAVQRRINRAIPEKVHRTLTAVVRSMVRGVLFGAEHTQFRRHRPAPLEETEARVRLLIRRYGRTAAAEGGVTGAGGILLGLADFPLLLAIKMKLLFDIATHYGFDVSDYRERVYILQVFGLAFSTGSHRQALFGELEGWQGQRMPATLEAFPWQTFQQEYRDFIDLQKMAQLIPGIGAVVGVVVNWKLIRRLGETAMMAYRMRRAEGGEVPASSLAFKFQSSSKLPTMALIDKYRSLVEGAEAMGVTNLSVRETPDVLFVDGHVPDYATKQRVWDLYHGIDPDGKSGDLVLNINVFGSEEDAGVRGAKA